MKRNIISILVLMLLIVQNYAQEFNQVVYSERTNSNILLGYCNRDGFAHEEFQGWFDAAYEAYNTNKEIIEKLTSLNTDNIIIKVVLGTWCSDSRREVPAFYKVMDETGFSEKKITIICVNRLKKSPGIDISELKINFVPTFIIYRSGKEIGRIIESPVNSMEEDLYNLLSLGKP